MEQSVVRPTHRFIATLDPGFFDLAAAEIRQAADSATTEQELAPGVLLVGTEVSFHDVARRWREHPPVFVRHVCPVDVTLRLEGTQEDLPRLEDVLLKTIAADVDAGQSFSIQSRVFEVPGYKPFDINTRLASALSSARGATVNVRQPQQVVSVVCAAGHTPGEYAGYIGLSNAEENLSDWAGGMRRYAREPNQVSRSEFKLLEALEVFQIDLPPRGVALDLGAAPGGWTRVLRQREQYVTAVDPGDLHPSIEADAGVRHLKITAEQYLGQKPDRYDLIVNDMRMDARDSARLMVQFADYLYADGLAIMTLKLPERNRKSVIDHAHSILARSYVVIGMKQLFHNRSEITLCLALHEDGRVS